MGLRMDDLHTPTVPSGPTTTASTNSFHGTDQEKHSLMELIDEKTKIEEELSALGSVLDSVSYVSKQPTPFFPRKQTQKKAKERSSFC